MTVLLLDRKDLAIIDKGPYYDILFLRDMTMEIMMSLKSAIEELLPALQKPLVVDMAAVSFLDSSAVGLLVLFYRHSATRHQTLVLHSLQPQPDAVLEMVGLKQLVTCVDTLEQALSRLSATT